MPPSACNLRVSISALGCLLIALSQPGFLPGALALPRGWLTWEPIAQAEGNSPKTADQLWEQGNAEFAAAQFAAALQSFQAALQLYRQAEDRGNQGIALVSLGEVYTALGNYPEAIATYQQALRIAREVENLSLERAVLFGLADCYEASGNVEQVIQLYDQLLPFLLENSDRYYGKALHQLGEFLLNAGRPELAEQQLTAGINTMERNLEEFFASLTSTEAAYIRDRYLAPYQVLQQALIAQNKPEAALVVAERSRARAFVALLAQQLAAIADNSPASAPLPAVPPPSLAQIRQIARQQNATLVEYSLIPRWQKTPQGRHLVEAELFTWVIAPTGEIQFRSIDLTALQPRLASLAELVQTSRQAIGVRGRGLTFQEDTNLVAKLEAERSNLTLNPQLQQLYQLLIQPIASLLPADPLAPVILVPYDSLFLIPFAALQDATGTYLIQQHTLVIAPSIQALDLTHQAQKRARQRWTPHRATDPILVVGNPSMPSLPTGNGQPQPLASLPGAEQEARAIATLFKTHPLIGKQATKAAVIQQMRTARLIHLATHGLLDDFSDIGIPGAIALAPAGQDQGFLTAGEILNLTLPAELVVLSACDTGQGNITGDGVVGLSRAFMAAGVPTVVVSLWKVPDAPTAFLMTQFYQTWQQEPGKARALRQAMLTTMQKYPNPRDWGAFTLLGESD